MVRREPGASDAKLHERHVLNRLRKYLRREPMIAGFLGVSLLLTPVDAERYGDTLQYALPLAGLGCAVVSGNTASYVTRFSTMWITVHGTKQVFKDTEISRRPRGGGRGFPSGHTAAATFGASSLVNACLDNAPVLKTAAVLGAAFTGASRVEAEKHNIWQVLAGAVWAILFERAFRRGSRSRAALTRLFRRRAA